MQPGYLTSLELESRATLDTPEFVTDRPLIGQSNARKGSSWGKHLRIDDGEFLFSLSRPVFG